jgi:uncharacterized cupin superfamily protein
MDVTKVLVTTKAELGATHIGFHPAYEYDRAEVLPRNGGNRCGVIFYDIAPGKSSFPFHYHSSSEEIFYIISGRGVVETNEGEIPVGAGSVVVCPAGEGGGHRITNTSDSEVLSYIDIDTVPETDMAVYPKTGKIGVFGNDGFMKIYKMDGGIKYYDGE